MILTFLSSGRPLTKRFTLQKDGTYQKESFLHAYHVSSHEKEINTVGEFATCLRAHARKGHCLLKGNTVTKLHNESRRGSTNNIAATSWICLDVDGLAPIGSEWLTEESLRNKPITVDVLLHELGLNDISYVLQWSASHGITSKDLRCHIFFLLDRPVPAPIIKQWLIQLNLKVELLRLQITLSKSGMHLAWPLDITASQNDKLIYIAPPECINFKDPMPLSRRIEVVQRTKHRFTFPDYTASAEQNREETQQLLIQLRQTAGLSKRAFKIKHAHGADVLDKAEGQTLTDIRRERGFVYFNINGGDSWAYYHPEDNPNVIYNFKGEPNYLTKELLPEYWRSLTQTAARTSGNKHWLAITDRKTGAYLKVVHTIDANTDELDVQTARSETQLRDFAAQYGIALGDFIPEWDVRFDPHDETRVDHTHKILNLFRPSPYMLTEPKPVTTIPPTIKHVIHHALNNEAPVVAHFLNWLAYIVQNRTRTETAWILQGVEGTGKGTIMNRILRPLFGRQHATMRLMHELTENYNPWMRSCFIVFIDEFEARALANEGAISARLRSYITEPVIPVRDLHTSPIDIDNHTNWIFSSNRPGAVRINRADRRFNVGSFQEKKIKLLPKDLVQIEKELQQFYDFLYHWEVDELAVREPIKTKERQNMIDATETGAEAVSTALLSGNLQFFLDALPSDNRWQGDPMRSTAVHNYRNALLDIMQRQVTSGVGRISRDELFTLFSYTVGNVPESPNKFTSYLRQVRIYTKNLRIDARVIVGAEVTWKDPATFPQIISEHFAAELATRETFNKAKKPS